MSVFSMVTIEIKLCYIHSLPGTLLGLPHRYTFLCSTCQLVRRHPATLSLVHLLRIANH